MKTILYFVQLTLISYFSFASLSFGDEGITVKLNSTLARFEIFDSSFLSVSVNGECMPGRYDKMAVQVVVEVATERAERLDTSRSAVTDAPALLSVISSGKPGSYIDKNFTFDLLPNGEGIYQPIDAFGNKTKYHLDQQHVEKLAAGLKKSSHLMTWLTPRVEQFNSVRK